MARARTLTRCPNHENHTNHPPGYVERSAWAEEMAKTHDQVRCPECGLFAIWVPHDKKEVRVASAHQREALKVVEPLGYRPVGYNSDGELIVTHPVGFSIALHKSPSDNRTMRNLLGDARRGIKRMEGVGPHFERWLWEKYSIEPGETKRLTLNVSAEVRQYFKENGIAQGGSIKTVATTFRVSDNVTNINPGQLGRGKRTWDVNRPAGMEIVELAEPDLSLKEGEPTTDELLGLPPVAPPIVVVENVERLDPELIKRLEDAFNEPVRAELSEQKERLGLVLGELEALDGHLRESMEYTMKAREMILGLTRLLEG